MTPGGTTGSLYAPPSSMPITKVSTKSKNKKEIDSSGWTSIPSRGHVPPAASDMVQPIIVKHAFSAFDVELITEEDEIEARVSTSALSALCAPGCPATAGSPNGLFGPTPTLAGSGLALDAAEPEGTIQEKGTRNVRNSSLSIREWSGCLCRRTLSAANLLAGVESTSAARPLRYGRFRGQKLAAVTRPVLTLEWRKTATSRTLQKP